MDNLITWERVYNENPENESRLSESTNSDLEATIENINKKGVEIFDLKVNLNLD